MTLIGLVISRVHISELFDFAEVVLYARTPFIGIFIMRDMDFAIAFRRDNGLCAARVQRRTQMVGIKDLVGHQGLTRLATQHLKPNGRAGADPEPAARIVPRMPLGDVSMHR